MAWRLHRLVFVHTHPKLRTRALLHRGLANERRLFILTLLLEHPRTGIELVRYLHIRPACVSRHLRMLITAGLVYGQRKGEAVKFYPVERTVRRYF